jgi:hypothetical protein
MRCREDFSVDPDQAPGHCGDLSSNPPRRSNPIERPEGHCPVPKSGSMQKFALKLLLTNLVFTRASKRVDGIQLVTTLMTMALIVFVGLYAWMHSFY